MSIQWEFTFLDLCILINFFQKFENAEHTSDQIGRVMLSAVREIGLRLQKKHIDLYYKNTPGDKNLSLKMPYHEAYFVEKWLSEVINRTDNSYEINVLLMNINQLNQKLV